MRKGDGGSLMGKKDTSSVVDSRNNKDHPKLESHPKLKKTYLILPDQPFEQKCYEPELLILQVCIKRGAGIL